MNMIWHIRIWYHLLVFTVVYIYKFNYVLGELSFNTTDMIQFLPLLLVLRLDFVIT